MHRAKKIEDVMLCIIAFVFLSSCSSGEGTFPPADGQDTAYDSAADGLDVSSDPASDPAGDFPGDPATDAPRDQQDTGEIPDSCIPPQVIIVLDRTMSMHQETGGTPKWLVALDAIAAMLAGYPETIWFGLELFPRDHALCVTLEQRIAGQTAGNPDCEDAEVVIPPGPATADAINARLAATLLCKSTPIEKAASAARDWYGANPPDIPERKQEVILITDGRETCEGDPPCPITAMSGIGVKTFVIGFGGEVNSHQLSSMACAGGTAPDAAQCDDADPACMRALADAPPQYYVAEDPAAFQAALDDIAGRINCGGPI